MVVPSVVEGVGDKARRNFRKGKYIVNFPRKRYWNVFIFYFCQVI